MSTTPTSKTSAADAARFSALSPADADRPGSGFGPLTLLMTVASLRLTVVMFALSIILVLAGTLAQIEHEIWYVVHHYFRTWFAWINFQVFFPRNWSIPGGMWFPGGWLIGAVMSVNLLTAHVLRFRISGKGKSLGIGFGLVAAGIAFTWFVIQSGLDDTIESELTPEFCNGLWHAMRFALGAGTLVSTYVLSLNYKRLTTAGNGWLWWSGAVFCALMLGLVAWLLTHPELKLNPSGLRIMWQLIKAGGASLVLLAGCQGVFGRRAGIVLLHGGIGLMMFSELWTGNYAQESQMKIAEGQTVSFSIDHRSTELAIIDKSDAKRDQVTVVPTELLLRSLKNEDNEDNEDKVFDDPALPFIARIVEYQQNSNTRFLQPGETSPATHGSGLLRVAEQQKSNSGVGETQGINIPAMYLELTSRRDKSSLGTYLLAPFLLSENLEIEGKPFQFALRFKQIQKPYSIKLVDFRFDRYVGSNTAKNFSSQVVLLNADKNVDREVTISMNNPLRYHGDTLYQSGWDEETERGTVLQVMTNSGWMIPYMGCMIVGTGMLAQFLSTFLRFARRQVTPSQKTIGQSPSGLLANWKSPAVWVPALLLLISTGYVLSKARTPKIASNEMQIHQFGELPVAYNGRVKPFDTLAREMLTVFSEKASLEIEDPEDPKETLKKPAVFWLLEFVSRTPASFQHQVFRIENLDVLQSLDLKPRKGFRYSYSEVTSKTFEIPNDKGEKITVPEVYRQGQLAWGVAEEERDLAQVKFVALYDKLRRLKSLEESFSTPAIRGDSLESIKQDFLEVAQQIAALNSHAPRAVPSAEPAGPWQTLLEAERDAILQQVQKKETNAATFSLRSIFDAYSEGEVQKFNSEVSAYQKIVQERSDAQALYETALTAAGNDDGRKDAEKLQQGRVKFEAFFNHFNPFKNALALYLAAFILAACSWLGWNTTLNRSANWLLWLTFALHTYALVCRVYISGRPPVTNLYSSAVFIGWAAVLFALLFERIYRFGLGNLLAAVIGFPTLLIAYYLEGDGDTFQVLQAVLDTQFWLATHVVCITLGYSTTLLAGVLGLFYVVLAHITNRLDGEQQKNLVRMIYGTICFAMFFSFIGTVLGGLWADDSWGRFWGWDPKENGALMIVIWNALVLHARWGALAKNRGMAVLAIFGNVITAWSWFGVNQMGHGLHAYGFRKGMTLWILLFVASQLAMMILGCIPATWWQSTSEEKENSTTQNA